MAGSMPMRDKTAEGEMHRANNNTSQFFITTKERNHAQGGCTSLHFDGRHVIFGRVVEGMKAVHQIQRCRHDPRRQHAMIDSVEIVECGQLKSKQEEADELEEAALRPAPKQSASVVASAPAMVASPPQRPETSSKDAGSWLNVNDAGAGAGAGAAAASRGEQHDLAAGETLAPARTYDETPSAEVDDD
jgi:hypothetical protein